MEIQIAHQCYMEIQIAHLCYMEIQIAHLCYMEIHIAHQCYKDFFYCRAHDDRVYLEQYSVLRELSARDEVECA